MHTNTMEKTKKENSSVRKRRKVKATIFDHTLYTRKEKKNTLKYTIIII